MNKTVLARAREGADCKTEKRRHDEIDGEKTVAAEEPKLKKGEPLNFEDITKDFIMLGVVGIFDPPRKGVEASHPPITAVLG
ncbi:hypothetical protein BLNAU_10040 [Blattamonas nauphoetae]|uniref:Uncharacterized protein n=1 Tax=Blattamonas nauphoetae TaxID=2049346 RepID=A0ABQ9XTT6_9EUKA|nr:hypothetical protein BLNAU_10040 [Blattamonas nauphoetae]